MIKDSIERLHTRQQAVDLFFLRVILALSYLALCEIGYGTWMRVYDIRSAMVLAIIASLPGLIGALHCLALGRLVRAHERKLWERWYNI